MADLALGAIGVVPVVEFVFKSFKGLYKNLKTFKEYAREAERIRRQLEVQEAIFKNEWKILRTVFLPTADDSNALDIALTMLLERASRRHNTKTARDPGPSEGYLPKQDMV